MATAEKRSSTSLASGVDKQGNMALSWSERKQILDDLDVKSHLQLLADIVNNDHDTLPDVLKIRKNLLTLTGHFSNGRFSVTEGMPRLSRLSPPKRPRYDFVYTPNYPGYDSAESNIDSLDLRNIPSIRVFSMGISTSGTYLTFDSAFFEGKEQVRGKCVIRCASVSDLQQGDETSNVWLALLTFVREPVTPGEVYDLHKDAVKS